MYRCQWLYIETKHGEPCRNLPGINKINFKICDHLSGIKSFNGYIDGKWILMAIPAVTHSILPVNIKTVFIGHQH
jgi:hypothetical protein